jgi:hypothetical protein
MAKARFFIAAGTAAFAVMCSLIDIGPSTLQSRGSQGDFTSQAGKDGGFAVAQGRIKALRMLALNELKQGTRPWEIRKAPLPIDVAPKLVG